MSAALSIRDAEAHEGDALGRLMVQVYSGLVGFPTPAEQPAYYEMLAGVARFAQKPSTRVLVALSAHGELAGGVVYFGDMAHYGSGGSATSEHDAAGIRLLAVAPAFRRAGVGRALTTACIAIAREQRRSQVILHTTQAMQTAWALYERLGFARSADLDFAQQGLAVYGFRLQMR